MKSRSFGLVLVMIAGVTGLAQTAQVALPVFDVVSVKPSQSEGRGFGFGPTGRYGWHYTGITVEALLATTYGIKRQLIAGLPGWGQTEKFDVVANVSEPDEAVMKALTKEQRQAMMVAALEERFGLKAHRETKELAVYELVVAKGGPKLVVSPPADETAAFDAKKPGFGRGIGVPSMRPGELTAVYYTVKMMVPLLEIPVERTIVDKTGLTGKYEWSLKYRKEGETGLEDAPSIFTALEEQEGLKLVPAKGPVVKLVVDHVERPSEN